MVVGSFDLRLCAVTAPTIIRRIRSCPKRECAGRSLPGVDLEALKTKGGLPSVAPSTEPVASPQASPFFASPTHCAARRFDITSVMRGDRFHGGDGVKAPEPYPCQNAGPPSLHGGI